MKKEETVKEFLETFKDNVKYGETWSETDIGRIEKMLGIIKTEVKIHLDLLTKLELEKEIIFSQKAKDEIDKFLLSH